MNNVLNWFIFTCIFSCLYKNNIYSSCDLIKDITLNTVLKYVDASRMSSKQTTWLCRP